MAIKCKGCIHSNLSGYAGYCDYLKNTGHCKIVKKVLPNGVGIKTVADPDDCPFFEPKVVRAPIDFELVQKLYKQGMNDREIGEEAECSGCVVWKWRKKNKLPPNKRKKPY